MVQVCLENSGYHVESVADGDAAWEVMTQPNPPEIAILDWEMPGITGDVLCRKIKRLERDSPIYVILLTARDSRKDISEGFDAGADDYITKPFNDDELQARIRVAERIVTIQSSLNSSLQELKAALDMVNAFQDQIAVCKQCGKIHAHDGEWKDIAGLMSYPVDPRFYDRDCPECKT